MGMNMFHLRLACVNSTLDYWQFISDFVLLSLLLLTLIVCLPCSYLSHFLSLLWLFSHSSFVEYIRVHLRNCTLESLPLWNINVFLISLSKNLSFRLAGLKIKGSFQCLLWPTQADVGGRGLGGGQIDGQGDRNTFLIGSQPVLVWRIEWYVGKWVRLIWTDNVCKWHRLKENRKSF